MSDNGKKWDRNQILTLIGIIVAAATLVASVVIPEMRNFFGLKDGNPPLPPVIHKAKESAGPKECTIGDNKSQRIEEAKTNLSIIFNEEYDIVTLTISPDGKQSSNRAVLNGYTEEFTSSTGIFLVHVLNVDWNRRTATVQVSRKR
jgi:hypothetical protein